MRGPWVLMLLFLLACDERNRPPGSGDAGLDAGQDAVADAGSDAGTGDGGADSGVLDSGGGGTFGQPILERTPDLAYDCAEGQPVTQPADRSWLGSYGWTYGLAMRAGVPTFGRLEQQGDPFGIPTTVEALVSTISPDATFGTPIEISIPSPELVTSAAVAELGTSFFFAFTDDQGAKLARISGTTIDGPKTVLSLGGMPQRVRVATRGDRGAVLFGVRGGNDVVAYHLQPIDANGDPTGAPFEVVRSARTFVDPTANIIATADGYAVAWRNTETQGGEIYFRLFDAAGQPAGETKRVRVGESRVGAGVGFDAAAVALIEIDGGFLIAWVENEIGDDFMSEAWAMVAVAKLDAGGEPVGPPAMLQTPEVDFDHVEPELFRHGDAVGLTWSKGDHIYICAGCVPNHAIRLVLLDPERLIPVSEVAEIRPINGGLLTRSTLSTGTDVITVFRVVFHVHSEAGVASFRCTNR